MIIIWRPLYPAQSQEGHDQLDHQRDHNADQELYSIEHTIIHTKPINAGDQSQISGDQTGPAAISATVSPPLDKRRTKSLDRWRTTDRRRPAETSLLCKVLKKQKQQARKARRCDSYLQI